MNKNNFNDSGIILLDPKSFETIHNSLYEQILDHLIVNSECDIEHADEFVLEFFDVFEHSKKMIVIDENLN